MANRSREQRLLDDHPGLRERVSQMDDFIRSRGTFSEPFYRGEIIPDGAPSMWSTSGVSPLRGMGEGLNVGS